METIVPAISFSLKNTTKINDEVIVCEMLKALWRCVAKGITPINI